jgi:hypothetical protein
MRRGMGLCIRKKKSKKAKKVKNELYARKLAIST